MEKHNWIITISGSEMDDVEAYRVIGTVEDVKEHLAGLVRKAKEENVSFFTEGETDASDIKECWFNGKEKLYAGAIFGNSAWSYDYAATLDDEPLEL